MQTPQVPGAAQPSASSFAVPSQAPDEKPAGGFVERRVNRDNGSHQPERRQFGSSHQGLTDEGRELALAIDRYKVENHRRYLTCDEMLQVLATLGYAKRS